MDLVYLLFLFSFNGFHLFITIKTTKLKQIKIKKLKNMTLIFRTWRHDNMHVFDTVWLAEGSNVNI